MSAPYYQDDLVTLFHGDCLEVIDWLSADVLVTDPPYGIAYVSNAFRYGSTAPIAGDGDLGVRDAALEAWGERPALVFGRWDLPRPAATRHRLIWSKELGAGMGDLKMPWGHGEEEIYVLGQGWTGRRESNVIRAKGYSAGHPGRPDHPTPKPIALMEHLIGKAPGGGSRRSLLRVGSDACSGPQPRPKKHRRRVRGTMLRAHREAAAAAGIRLRRLGRWRRVTAESHEPLLKARTPGEWHAVECKAEGCVFYLSASIQPAGYFLDAFERLHGRQYRAGNAPDLVVAWVLSTECPVCPGGGEVVMDDGALLCRECESLWDSDGEHGVRAWLR